MMISSVNTVVDMIPSLNLIHLKLEDLKNKEMSRLLSLFTQEGFILQIVEFRNMNLRD